MAPRWIWVILMKPAAPDDAPSQPLRSFIIHRNMNEIADTGEPRFGEPSGMRPVDGDEASVDEASVPVVRRSHQHLSRIGRPCATRFI